MHKSLNEIQTQLLAALSLSRSLSFSLFLSLFLPLPPSPLSCSMFCGHQLFSCYSLQHYLSNFVYFERDRISVGQPFLALLQCKIKYYILLFVGSVPFNCFGSSWNCHKSTNSMFGGLQRKKYRNPPNKRFL